MMANHGLDEGERILWTRTRILVEGIQPRK